MTRASARGIVFPDSEGSGGDSLRMAAIASADVFPAKARLPVTIS